MKVRTVLSFVDRFANAHRCQNIMCHVGKCEDFKMTGEAAPGGLQNPNALGVFLL